MQIRYVSNACYLITLAEGRTILTDPWFDGPCHQTWHNFPPVHEELKAEIWGSRPDFIYISHLHHDHLHPRTLAPFDRSTPVVIGKLNTKNLSSALKRIGFSNLVELEFEAEHRLTEAGCRLVLFKDFHGNTAGDDTLVDYDLDTSMYLFDSDGVRAFNAVDNTILPTDAERIAAQHGRPDVAMLPYASASLYPMAMDYPPEQKAAATAKLRARTAGNFRDVFRALGPRWAIPAGGEYVLGGPAAPLSRYLPQPLERDLQAELDGLGLGEGLCKLYSGDSLDAVSGEVRRDERARLRGFDDAARAAYALTLEDQPPEYMGVRIPEGLEFDWARALPRCAANFRKRREAMGVTPAMDVWLDVRSVEDGAPRFQFRMAMDGPDAGFGGPPGEDGRPFLVYGLDDKLLFCLVTGLLSWNAMEISSLISVRRVPDVFTNDLHRSIVHFSLLA